MDLAAVWAIGDRTDLKDTRVRKFHWISRLKVERTRYGYVSARTSLTSQCRTVSGRRLRDEVESIASLRLV